MADMRKALYAVLGTGQLAVEKAKGLFKRARSFVKTQRKDSAKNYRDLVRRGERIIGSIRRSEPVKRATAQTKAAQRQAKAAATSIRKAVRADVEAVEASAKKVS